MKRILNSTTVFATIVSVSLTVHAVQANGTNKNANAGGSRTRASCKRAHKWLERTRRIRTRGRTQPSRRIPAETPPVRQSSHPTPRRLAGIFNKAQGAAGCRTKSRPEHHGHRQHFQSAEQTNPTPTPTPKPTKPPMGNGRGFGGYGGLRSVARWSQRVSRQRRRTMPWRLRLRSRRIATPTRPRRWKSRPARASR